MLDVSKMSAQAQIAVPNKAPALPHHPVFSRFACWQGKVPKDFVVNFLGVFTRVDYYEGYSEIDRQYPADRYVRTAYPSFDEEYFEWIDLLEAVVGAEDHFTMLELGAGHGRWTANAAAALKHLGGRTHTLIAVEAEPTHFRWMSQHFEDNLIDRGSFQLIQAAAAGADGKVGFHVGETQFGGPTNWYGQSIGGADLVDSVSLNTLLRPLDTVDLLDLDVQGAELEVLAAAAAELDEKVKRVHIGTHGAKIEEGLHSLFARLGWKCVRAFPCAGTADTEWGTMSFQDGVQTWVNPAYASQPRDNVAVLTEKLEASRREGTRLWQELEKERREFEKERQRIRTLDSTSLAWRAVVRAGRLRDRLAPAGTRLRKVFDFVAKRI